MSTLHRAQIYIGREQMKRLKLEAEREHLAVSELVRRAIDRFLKAKERSVDWEEDPLYKAIGAINLSVTDASINHDHYLYGKKKKG
ncbi:MAG: ribbon-helix-helix protein, CopG family [Candidatus Omnitrophota bacterium]